MMDRDGLPVVDESYKGVERVADFRAQLTRQADALSKPAVLHMQFVGNKQKRLDETGAADVDVWERVDRPSRNRHGHVEVRVEVTMPGLHFVDLSGLENSGGMRFAPFHWRVSLEGVCPASESEREAGQKCYCNPGYERPPDNEDEPCQVCRSGNIKDWVGDEECDTCINRNRLRFGFVDPHRQETRGPGRRNAALHDSLSDCGCSVNYFRDFVSLTPRSLRHYCPAASDVDKWHATARRGMVERLRSTCCKADATVNDTDPFSNALESNCGSQKAWSCIERACREEYLNNVALSVELNSSERGMCKSCDPEIMRCNETFLSTRRVPLRSGWWRTNELSTEFWPCSPKAACLQTSSLRPTLTENMCRDGHWGPFCSVCYDHYFKNAGMLCTSCADVGLSLLIKLLPLLVALCVLLCCCLIGLLQYCARSHWDRVVEAAHTMKTCLRQVFGKISLRAMSVIALPKIKALVSMVQVQMGASTVFAIRFPERFAKFLSWLTIVNVVDLPLECVGTVHYRTRLMGYTIIPLIIAGALAILSRVFAKQRNTITEVLFLMIFLLYPGVSSIIFSAFSCTRFDDGTRFLTVELSVNCDTSDHEITIWYACVMIFVYPIGVPLLYYLVCKQYSKHLDAVGRLQIFLRDPCNVSGSQQVSTSLPNELEVDVARYREQRRTRACLRLRDSIKHWEEEERSISSTRDLREPQIARRTEVLRNLRRARRIESQLRDENAVAIDDALRLLNKHFGPVGSLNDANTGNIAQDGDESSWVPPAEIELVMQGRAEAHQRYAEWHPVLGIELDPNKEQPTVLRVWPAAYPHGELSEAEEEVISPVKATSAPPILHVE